MCYRRRSMNPPSRSTSWIFFILFCWGCAQGQLSEQNIKRVMKEQKIEVEGGKVKKRLIEF